MQRILLIICLLGLGLPNTSLLSQTQIHPEIDAYIQTIQKRNQIPGIALAVIKDGKIIHKQKYGYVNLEHRVPMHDHALFRLYSLTKPIVTVSIFRLIEEGKISLEDKVSAYITDLPKTWQPLQIKHLLSFSSGLPDMGQPYLEIRDLNEAQSKERVFALPLTAGAGERFEYNQTCFWLLQKIAEQVSQKSLTELLLQHQFTNPIDTVFFSSDSREIIQNRATPYFPYATGHIIIDHPQYTGAFNHASNALHMGLEDFIVWDKKFREDQFITKESKDKMWEAFPYTQSEDVFAYGWGKYEINGHESYGFSGSGCTVYRIFPEDNISIIFLSNGMGRSHDLWSLAQHIAYLLDEDIFDANTVFFEEMRQAAEQKDRGEVEAVFDKLSAQEKYHAANLEGLINTLGYTFSYVGEMERALKVFHLNVKKFPNSWNVFDSLGEAYEQIQNREQAIRNYEKAIQLNTENENDNNTRLKGRIEQLMSN